MIQGFSPKNLTPTPAAMRWRGLLDAPTATGAAVQKNGHLILERRTIEFGCDGVWNTLKQVYLTEVKVRLWSPSGKFHFRRVACVSVAKKRGFEAV